MMVCFLNLLFFIWLVSRKIVLKLFIRKIVFICEKDKYEGVGSSFSLFIYFENVV